MKTRHRWTGAVAVAFAVALVAVNVAAFGWLAASVLVALEVTVLVLGAIAVIAVRTLIQGRTDRRSRAAEPDQA